MEEYKKGTDPHLEDSDFDGVSDKDDFGDTSPRKTDNTKVAGTDRLVAHNAQVYIGLYDREYEETEDGVTTTYVSNIYRGNIKSIYTDYEDETLNRKLKYFYDENGNNTAVVEENLKNSKHTVCITYTYGNDGNVTYICDQSTKYTMSYEDGEMSEIKVGNQSLAAYENNSREATEAEKTEEAGKIKTNISENITLYGKNSQGEADEQSQKVRTVTTDYETDSDTAIAQKVELFYGDTDEAAYVTELNSKGKVIKFTDKSKTDDVEYNYSYTDNTTKVERSDGLSKEIVTEEDSCRRLVLETIRMKRRMT